MCLSPQHLGGEGWRENQLHSEFQASLGFAKKKKTKNNLTGQASRPVIRRHNKLTWGGHKQPLPSGFGWPLACSNPPASASLVLGFQTGHQAWFSLIFKNCFIFNYVHVHLSVCWYVHMSIGAFVCQRHRLPWS